MITSFIHFQDLHLRSIEAHSYKDGMKPRTDVFQFSEISNNLADSSNIFIMIPSQLFGFMSYQNDEGFKGEILRANVLMQIEDQLVSDVSSLKFFYNSELKLASWIDYRIFKSIIDRIEDIDAEIILLPEHFLIRGDANSAIFMSSESFTISFEDNSGFGGPLASLHDYLSILDPISFNINTLAVLKDHRSVPADSIKELSFKIKSLSELHKDALAQKKLSNFNFYSRKFSYNFLRSKFKVNGIESFVICSAVLFILIAPTIINTSLHSSISFYQEKTTEIFQQLNPGFKRLVNAKAQIDDLTRDIPLQKNLSNQNIQAMKYLEKLQDEAIKNISINFKQGSIELVVENLAPYKLKLFETLLAQYPLKIDSSELVNNSEHYFGKLTLNYNEK